MNDPKLTKAQIEKMKREFIWVAKMREERGDRVKVKPETEWRYD